MKKIRFDNVVQVKYFNKDDIIKKDSDSVFFSRIKIFLLIILITLILKYFINLGTF